MRAEVRFVGSRRRRSETGSRAEQKLGRFWWKEVTEHSLPTSAAIARPGDRHTKPHELKELSEVLTFSSVLHDACELPPPLPHLGV